jgi:uncharacterized membrane protein
MSSRDLTANVLGSYDGKCWRWHHKRNISMAPAHMALIFTGLSLVSLIIALAFYWAGASLILPFSLFEILCLGMAYFYNAVHANDYETLILSDKLVHIESQIGLNFHQVQLTRSMTRLGHSNHKNALIEIKQGQQSSYFGQFVHANLRPALATQITTHLQAGFNK